MALPDPEVAKTWGGRTIVDRVGAVIGACTQVYTDDATGVPEWATARMGNVSLLLPLVDVVEDAGWVRVSVTRDEALLAPSVVDQRHISPDEEARLYRHFGIPFSQERSRTLLPVGEAPQAAARTFRDEPGGATGTRTAGLCRWGPAADRKRAMLVAALVVAALAAVVGALSGQSRRRRSAREQVRSRSRTARRPRAAGRSPAIHHQTSSEAV